MRKLRGIGVFVHFLSMMIVFRTGPLAAQVNVLTANYDNSRTNSNLNETILAVSNVAPGTFGKIGSFPVDGQIYAQPLYAAGIQIRGLGTRNVVYTVTMHNSVYAIDADAPASVVPLWQVNLGPSVPSSVLDFTDILPEVGILSTPVIDLVGQAIYVVSDTLEDGVPVFRLHALSLADGHEMFNGPAIVAGAVVGTGAGSISGSVVFDASMQLQRPGLALANGMVYLGFGSHADAGDFHGWMIAYDAGDLRRRVAVFNTTPNSLGGSFWQAGRAPAIDSAGNIVAASGNSEFADKPDFGNSVLRLSGSDLSLLDWFTPEDCSKLNDDDLDLGSGGPILLPATNQILAIGKSGQLLLINGDSMGHLGPWNSTSAQSFRVTDSNVSLFANVAVWQRGKDATVYVLEPCGPLKAYQIVAGRLDPAVLSRSNPTTCTKFAGIAVSAKDSLSGSAVVWQTTGDFSARQIPGTLHAFGATDLSHELWNSDLTPDRDTLGRYAKFVAPTVVNGRVYVPTFSNRLVIYGMLPGAGQTNDDVRITAIANSASLLQGALSPGEVVTISGSHMGPETMSCPQVGQSSGAGNGVDETRVFFNGVLATLLYTSSGEIGAMVPFDIAGLATDILVVYHERQAAVSIPVVPAAPALFALDGTGGGQGAILNADGSVNSWDHPAAPGSIVALFGTGLGQMDKANQVTAFIDGQPAEILYAGPAPGMVPGVVQVNIRVPRTISYLGDVPVALKVGTFASPSTITVNVQ